MLNAESKMLAYFKDVLLLRFIEVVRDDTCAKDVVEMFE